MAAEQSVVHLSFEKLDGPSEVGAQGDAEVETQGALIGHGFSPHHHDNFRVGDEELEAGLDDRVDELPTVGIVATGHLYLIAPIGQCVAEDLAVDGLFGVEVMQQTRSANANTSRDVVQRGPFKPLSGEAGSGLNQDLFAC